MCFVLFSWTKGKRHANNRSQERQYVKLSFALSAKEARGGRCEKYRFIKIKQHKEVISVSLQKSQEIYLILRNIISRSLPIYCLIIHFLKSLKRYLVSETNRISISDLRISVFAAESSSRPYWFSNFTQWSEKIGFSYGIETHFSKTRWIFFLQEAGMRPIEQRQLASICKISELQV